MRILIASDKFKGSLTAAEACSSIHDGFEGLGHEIRCVPVADGGDGMAKTLTEAQTGTWCEDRVSGPLGDPVTAGYGLIDGDKTAVIEMAEASGIALLGDTANDPWRASTFGTGQLIGAAMERGAEKVLLGIGGSATNDGGVGMALALGFQFLDEKGMAVTSLPEDLTRIAKILPPEDWQEFPETTVACDVSNPLLGPAGCTRIYGPQKGVSQSDFEKHEERLHHLLTLFGDAGIAAAKVAGSGAAGGLGFGSLVFLNAKLVPGFDLVSDVLELEKQVEWADLVITGEGKIDAQSLEGKAPAGVASLGKKSGRKVVGFCGLRGDGDFSGTFDHIFEIEKGTRTVEESMREGAELLRLTVAKRAGEFLSS